MPRTFIVAEGTMGLLLVQEQDTDLSIKNFQATKTKHYTEEHVLVDPVKVASFGKAVYESDSHAQRLGKDGYIVFSDVANEESKYMFAVPYNQVNITR